MYEFGQGDPGYGQFAVSGFRDQSRVVAGQPFAPRQHHQFPDGVVFHVAVALHNRASFRYRAMVLLPHPARPGYEPRGQPVYGFASGILMST